MTKKEIAESLRLDERGTFDYALPQPWVEDMTVRINRHAGQIAVCGFVWLYDEKNPVFGRPFPLTDEARKVLAIYNERAGTKYPLN